MATPTLANIYTTVLNPLATSRFYGYLSYHGKVVPSLGTFTFPGDIRSYLMRKGPTGKRWIDALERDLIAVPPNIIIVSTPAVFLEDTVTLAVKVLNVTSGTLGTADPSWGAYTV